VKPDALLVVIDMQAKLMPHIDAGESVLRQCRTLVATAGLLDLPVLVTEQNPHGLGRTVDGLIAERHRLIEKDTFDATLNPAFVAGCEAHVCVLLTVLGLRRLGYPVELIADATGSRTCANKASALRRAELEGARPTTAETTVFGWLGSCRHPDFRRVLALVK
jgi:nicotinamidase-related amidase